MTLRPARLGFAGLAFALSLTGCSSDDPSTDDTTDADASATARPDGGTGSPGDAAAASEGSTGLADSAAPGDGGPADDAADAGDAGERDAEAGSTAGFFVGVGYGGRRVRSVDGITWTDDQADIPDGGDDQYLLRDVSSGGGVVLAAGYKLQRSPDGKTWTESATMGQWLGGISYAKGLWVGAGGYGRNSWSDDGMTWTDVDDPHTDAFRAIAYGSAQGGANGRWVAAGDNGRCRYTGDGKAWSDGASVGFGVGDLAYGAGTYVAVGGTAIATSADGGMTWTARTAFSASVDSVVYGAGQFVAVGSGHAYRSADGVTWKDSASAGASGPSAYGDGVYVSIDYGGGVHRSTDGITFTSPAKLSGSGNAINRLRWVTP